MRGRLLALLAPARCLGCRQHGHDLCDGCYQAVVGSPPVAGAVAADEGPAAGIVRAGKGGARVAAQVMTGLTLARLDAGLASLPVAPDVITWVPHDPVRGSSRGYHLPELYARGLAGALGVQAVQLLQRRHGRPQRGASRAVRHANLDGSFSACRQVPAEASAVLLVDDVRTTGATFAHAARCLISLGEPGLRVAAFAFTSVPRRATSGPESGFPTGNYGLSREDAWFSYVGLREPISHDESGPAIAGAARTPPPRSGRS